MQTKEDERLVAVIRATFTMRLVAVVAAMTLALITAFLGFPVSLALILVAFSFKATLTDRRLTVQWLMHKRAQPLDRVESITVWVPPLLEWMVGGSVTVRGIGGGKTTILYVRNTEAFQVQLERAIEAAKAAPRKVTIVEA